MPIPSSNAICWRGRSHHNNAALVICRVEPYAGIHHYVLIGTRESEPIHVSESTRGDGQLVRAAFIRYVEAEYGCPQTNGHPVGGKKAL
jgi:hypothetical protein